MKFCRINHSHLALGMSTSRRLRMHALPTFKFACLAVSSTPSRNLSAAAFSWLIPSLLFHPIEPEVSRHKTVSKGILYFSAVDESIECQHCIHFCRHRHFKFYRIRPMEFKLPRSNFKTNKYLKSHCAYYNLQPRIYVLVGLTRSILE